MRCWKIVDINGPYVKAEDGFYHTECHEQKKEIDKIIDSHLTPAQKEELIRQGREIERRRRSHRAG